MAKQNSQFLADQLEERLIDFAVRIIKLSANLPRTPAGNHIAGQILRAGTRLLRITEKREVQRATQILSTSCASY
jgi:hypothetical protein